MKIKNKNRLSEHVLSMFRLVLCGKYQEMTVNLFYNCILFSLLITYNIDYIIPVFANDIFNYFLSTFIMSKALFEIQSNYFQFSIINYFPDSYIGYMVHSIAFLMYTSIIYCTVLA